MEFTQERMFGKPDGFQKLNHYDIQDENYQNFLANHYPTITVS